MNYPRFHIVANGVPLSYIICENESPDHDTVHTDLVNQEITCSPLDGECFTAYKLSSLNTSYHSTPVKLLGTGRRIHLSIRVVDIQWKH